MRLYLVSTNSHKVREISSLVPPGFFIESLGTVVNSCAVEEDGITYVQNALKKLEAFLDLGLPLISDDSGLEIEALGAMPGVNSARYLGDCGFDQKMKDILLKLRGVTNRRARFVCAAAYTDSKGTYVAAEGIVEGTVSHEMRGEHGFGYDPIFIPENTDMTFAELGSEFKNSCSHRYRAFKRLFELLSLCTGSRS